MIRDFLDNPIFVGGKAIYIHTNNGGFTELKIGKINKVDDKNHLVNIEDYEYVLDKNELIMYHETHHKPKNQFGFVEQITIDKKTADLAFKFFSEDLD